MSHPAPSYGRLSPTCRFALGFAPRRRLRSAPPRRKVTTAPLVYTHSPYQLYVLLALFSFSPWSAFRLGGWPPCSVGKTPNLRAPSFPPRLADIGEKYEETRELRRRFHRLRKSRQRPFRATPGVTVSSSRLRHPPRLSLLPGRLLALPSTCFAKYRTPPGEALCGALTSPTATRRGGRLPRRQKKKHYSG